MKTMKIKKNVVVLWSGIGLECHNTTNETMKNTKNEKKVAVEGGDPKREGVKQMITKIFFKKGVGTQTRREGS